MVKTIFLTNDEDRTLWHVKCQTTLTVTYAVIVACVIETRTVFNPARSWIVQILLRASRPLLAIAPG